MRDTDPLYVPEDPPKGSPTNPYITPRQAGCLLVIAVLVVYALVRSAK